jgi:hypothetical protein
MVFFLTLPDGAGHVAQFVRHFGRRHSRRMSEMTYSAFLGLREVPRGVYVFADSDRMTPLQRRLAGRIWEALEAHGDAVRLLNDPRRQLGRYDLLRRLHRQGVNEYQVWRPHELPEAVPFPVFVRKENDHGGPRSGLLHSMAELWRALGALALEGVAQQDMIVCQFQETADREGIYRKYGALRVGDRVFGQFVILERRWEKSHSERVRTPEARAENQRYFQENPHQDMLRPLFELAHVEYGRIDYAFRNGRIQVWEINDNPFLATPVLAHFIAENGIEAYVEALDMLMEGVPDDGVVPLNLKWSDWGESRV